MKKTIKENMVQEIIRTGNLVKENLEEEIDITIVDYMVTSALEKLGLNEKHINRQYMKG